jgi:hypothetical protein
VSSPAPRTLPSIQGRNHNTLEPVRQPAKPSHPIFRSQAGCADHRPDVPIERALSTPKRSLNGRSGYAVRLMLVVLRPAVQPDMKPRNAKSGCTDPEAAAWSLQASLGGPSQRFQQGMLLFLRSRSKERAQMTVAHAPCQRLGYDKDRVPTNIGKRSDQVRSGGSLQQGQKRCGVRGSPVKQPSLKDNMLVGVTPECPSAVAATPRRRPQMG